MTSQTARANKVIKKKKDDGMKRLESQWRKLWDSGIRGEDAYLSFGGTDLDLQRFLYTYAG